MAIQNSALITLAGLPYDGGSSFMKGPAQAPAHIREALKSESSNLWSELGVHLGAPGIFADVGDIDCGEPEAARKRIETEAARLAASGTIPIFLGGDHSVTWPVIRGMSGVYPQLEILHFDAHPDLYDQLDGDRFSHACPFARIMEAGLARNLIQVGVRTVNGHQREQAERFGVTLIDMRHPDLTPLKKLSGPLYLSFDLDALDPAFAPGVSHYEPGGMSVREAIRIIQDLEPEIVGADIVELNPCRDFNGITAMAAAKLLKEMMGKCIMQKRGEQAGTP